MDVQPSRRKVSNEKCFCFEKSRSFSAGRHIPPTRFGRDVVGDPRFVFDLRKGREPRPQTVARVRAYLEAVR